jgi:hypothetical protein
LLPAILAGAEWRIVDIVRQGSPPYLEEDRLYRIEGKGCNQLEKGSRLQIQRPENGRFSGTMVVVKVGDNYVLAILEKKTDTYPLKGDLAFQLDDPKNLPPVSLPSPLFSPLQKGIGTTSSTPVAGRSDLPGTRPVQPMQPKAEIKPGQPKLQESGSVQPQWTIGLIRQAPSFSGDYYKKSGSSLDAFDTARDLLLTRSGVSSGLLVDVHGPRFLIHFGTFNVTYQGNAIINRDVNLDTTTYHSGALIQSEVSLRDYEVDWTTKLWWKDRNYVGLDLGVNYWVIQATVAGQGYLQTNPTTQVFSNTKASMLYPIPQIGISAGLETSHGLSGRAYLHVLQMRGASYQRYGVDARCFPFKHLGLRVNFEQEGFKVPLGSVSNNMALHLNKNGWGFGLVVHY